MTQSSELKHKLACRRFCEVASSALILHTIRGDVDLLPLIWQNINLYQSKWLAWGVDGIVRSFQSAHGTQMRRPDAI